MSERIQQMRFNSKLTWGLAWAGLAVVLVVPSADYLTGVLGKSKTTTALARLGSPVPDRHRPRRHSRCHVRMYDHSTGECLIERRCITSVIQKAHFIGASCLQRGHAFEQQIALVSNPTCHSRNSRQRMRPTSAKEPRVARRCFDHIPLPVQDLGLSL